MKNKVPFLLEFLQYIAKPSVQVEKKPTFHLILFNVIRLWSIIFAISIFFALISNLLLKIHGYSEDDLVLTQIIEELDYFLILFLVIIWTPISEEIGFRLWLRFSPLKWGLGLGFFALFFLPFVDIPFIPTEIFTFDSVSGSLGSMFLVGCIFLFVFFLLKFKEVGLKVEKFFTKNFRFFFYSVGIFFAIIHISNYDVDLKSIWYFAPLLIFPQLFLSFSISFIRMRYGFAWAVFTHALNNSIAIIPLLILMPLLETEGILVGEFSTKDVFLLLIGFSFLMMIFLVCLLSILSLILEFTKRD